MELKTSPVSFKARIVLNMPQKIKKQTPFTKKINIGSNDIDNEKFKDLRSKMIMYFTKLRSKLLVQVKLPS